MAENILHRRKVDAREAGKSNEQRYEELLDEQGEISGKAKKSYSLYKYIDKKERPQLAGVYHNDGYAIATDTFVLVADRRKYDKENEGRIIDKDGNEIEGQFPNAFAIVPRRIISSDIDAMDLLNFIAGVKAIVKSKNEKLKDKVILFNVGGELWAGSVENLEKFANAAVSLGGKIYFNDNVGTGIYTRPIYTESDKGFAMLMPIDFTRYSIDKENYFAYKPSEMGAETDSMVGKEKHQFGEGGELRMVQELTDKSRNDMQTVARSLGVDLVFDDTLEENGRYTTIDKATGRPTIHVAMNASNTLESVFGHEATHRVKSLDEGSYSELHDVARLMIGDDEFFDRANRKKELYAKNGITLSDADAREEVVSDYIGSLIYDKEHMGKVANKLSHPILSKIRDVVSDFLDYFRKNKMTADERLAKGSLRAIDRAFARASNSVQNDTEGTKYSLGDTVESFKERQKRAVENRGTVMPGLNETEVKMVNVPRHNFYGTGKEALASSEEWAKDNIVGSHTYIHNGYKPFDYEISNKSIEKYLSYTSVSNSDNMGVHLAVLKKLPEVINESIEVEEHPDYSKGKDGKRNENNAINDNELIHRFYGSVLIDGKVYRVKTTFKEYKDNSHHAKAYTYEVTKIELIEAPFTDTNRNSNLVAMTTTNSIPLAKLLNGVEKSYDKGKKLLDESKNNAISAGGDKYSLRKGGKEYRNNGYTQRADGTNISVRAQYAEEEGSFSKGNFAKHYGVAKNDFDVLNELGIIKNTEWHHTGVNFGKTDFYSWKDSERADGDVYYGEFDDIPDNSFSSIYKANKSEISNLVKESKSKEWTNVPNVENDAEALADFYSNDAKGKPLMKLMQMFGYSPEEASRRIYSAHINYLKQSQMDRANKASNDIKIAYDAKIALEEGALDKWINKAVKDGKATFVERVLTKPENFVETKVELKGRYGWYVPTYRHTGTKYYSGYSFSTKRMLDSYNKRAQSITNLQRERAIESNRAFSAVMSEDYNRSKYSIREGVSEREAELRDALADKMRETGVNVVTDSAVAQRVLDMENGGVRMQASLNGLKKASDFILSLLQGTTKQRKAKLEIPSRANRLAENAIGHPINSHTINANEIVHSKKRHGINGTANTENSIPLRDEDFALMPYIMAAPTRVVKGSTSTNGTESVRYEKELSNGIVIVVEREGRFDVGDMENITMWAQKKSATNVTVAQRASHSTSETIVISEADVAKIRKDAENAIANDAKISMHKVFHGSGAEFDAFDFSHMGEGEGGQAFGWGGYVSEAEGVGRVYSSVANDSDTLYSEIASKATEVNNWSRLIERAIKDGREQYVKNHEPFLSKAKSELKELEQKASGLAKRILYSVEIPDDNGSNYLHWEKPIGGDMARKVKDALYQHIVSNDEEGMYADKQSRDAIKAEIEAMDANAKGGDVYGDVSAFLGGDKQASEFLSSIGFTGVSYPTNYFKGGNNEGTRNYVIFNESDMRITDKVRFFRTSDGEAYGFVKDGAVYIDNRIAKSDTPIHEYSHLWADALRNRNRNEWEHVVNLMKDTTIWEDVKNRYQELETDNEVADEVLAHYSGSRGAERLRAEQQKLISVGTSPLEKATAVSAIARVKDALNRFWRGVSNFLGIRYTNAEQVADKVLSDLLNGVNPNSKSPVTKFQIIGEKGAEALDKAQEATIRIDNLSVAREMEKAGKDAKTIRLATGWERGADGKWRYEIPDEYNIEGSDMILDRYIERMEEKRNKLLKIYNEKSKLYDNYGRLLYYIDTEIKSIPTRNSTAEQKEKRKALQKKRKDIVKEQKNIGLFNARDDYDNLKRDLDLKWTNLLEVLGEKHPLFDAYPQFKNIHVTYDSKGETNFLGYYIKEWNQIWINPNVRRNQSSIFAHEIQHAIQYEEGFARGGSAEEMQKDFDDAKQEVSARIWMRALQEKAKGSVNKTTEYIEEELIKDYEQEGLEDMIPDLVTRDIGRKYYERGYADISKDEKIKRFNLDTSLGDNFNAFKSYRSISGEVESRNVEARMNMSDQERREKLLADTEDVARKDQIFLFENLGESQMGSRVDKRMAEVGEYFGRKELSDNERAVVDVFSGKSDNKAITVERDGKQHKVVMRQGNENKAGTKHSLFRHYGTNSGVISSEDLLLVPQVIERGEKEMKGNGIAYKLKKDGVSYIVYNEIHKNQEQFCDFYTNRKGSSTHPSNTQLSAQVDSATTNSDTKVVENFENPTIESKKSALSADGDKYSLRKGGKEYRNNGYTQRDKFSVRANDELEKKSLVGIHNLTDDNLRYAIKLGGLANPSTAVVDTDIIGLEGFGDISMIMPKSLVDKRTGKNVGTYAGDAYTPRFPKGDIVKHISSKGEKKINQDYQGNDRFSRDFREAWHNYGNEYGGITPTLYYLYKLENGGADVVKHEGPKIKSEYHRMMIDKYGDKEWIELSDVDKQELVEYRRKEIKESLKNVEKSMVDKVVDDLINSSDFDTLAYKKYRSLKMDYNEQKNAGDVDYKGTYNKAQNDVIMSGEHDKFAKWLDEKSIRYEIEDRIFRGYTPSGNRKYAPLTLSNISKVMKESGRAGSETLMGGSPHSLRGKMLPSYKTLESIKKNKGRLSDKETYERIRDEINNEYNELISTIRDIKGVDYNDAYYILEDALLKGFDYAEREAGITIDSNTKERISAFGKLLKESPVKYFETKFERPVMLNEFVAAVVPKDIDAELKNSLIDNGIAIEEYERGNEESRLYAIKRASNREDVKFSLRDDGSMIEGAEEAKPVTLRSILSDRNIGLKEQITLSKALLAEQNKSDKTLLNDFVRSVTDNLSDVRKAMSAQKVYDQATVKRVADLAKIMLSAGHLSNLGKGEQGRLLSAVKNSAGAYNNDESVQKIMDIMVSNQLKNGELALRELESKKGTRVDSSRVQHVGELDPAGNIMLDAFKKCRRMSDDYSSPDVKGVASADFAAVGYLKVCISKTWLKSSKIE